MVEERRVLLGVEHLKKCTRRVAIMTATDLVNLVNEHERVLSAYTLQGLNDLSREGSKHGYNSVTLFRNQDQYDYVPDIGPPVPLDLRNIRQAADRETEELPVERASDRLANRCLSHTRRADETNDLAFDCSAELANCEELEDTVLDILETVMVLIENFLRIRDRVVLA